MHCSRGFSSNTRVMNEAIPRSYNSKLFCCCCCCCLWGWETFVIPLPIAFFLKWTHVWERQNYKLSFCHMFAFEQRTQTHTLFWIKERQKKLVLCWKFIFILKRRLSGPLSCWLSLSASLILNQLKIPDTKDSQKNFTSKLLTSY